MEEYLGRMPNVGKEQRRTLDNVYEEEKNGNESNFNKNVKKFEQTQVQNHFNVRMTNHLFALGTGLYPAIILSLKDDDSIQLPESTNLFNLIFFFGAVLGVLLSVCINTFRCSRTLFLKISGFLSLIGMWWMWSSKNYNSLIVGRLIAGIGMGIHSVIIYYYTYECIFEHKVDKGVTKVKLRGVAFQSIKKDFVQGTLLTLILGWFNKWRNTLFIGILYNIAALFMLHRVPESPYRLLLNGEELEAQEAFYNLTRVDTTETRDCFDKIQDEAAETKVLEKKNLMASSYCKKRSSMIESYFLINELSGITVYYYYMTTFFESRAVLSVIIVISLFFHEALKADRPMPKRTSFFKLLKVSSYYMKLNSLGLLLLATVQYFDFTHYSFIIIKILLLHWYFNSYASGWIYGRYILLETNDPYYIKMKRIPAALFAKYAAVSCLTYVYSPSAVDISVWSIVFSICSYLNSVFILSVD